jgi:thymidylate synthase (FAD)
MKVELISNTENSEKLIEKCGRTCYQSKGNESSEDRFITSIIKNGHFSVLENAVATFNIKEISRICTHQLVRSRLASFSQKSERYCSESDSNFIIPDDIKKDPLSLMIYESAVDHCKKAYNDLLERGIKKENARFIIPQSIETEINVTMNYREILHTIDLRVSLKAQWEIRDLFIEIWRQLYYKSPNVFGLTYFENWSKDFDYKKHIFENLISNDR